MQLSRLEMFGKFGEDCLMIKRLYLVFFILFVLFSYSSFGKERITTLDFKEPSGLRGMLSNEVQKIYQDQDGFIWIATRHGLYQYDGYRTVLFRSDVHSPGLLSDNNVFCLTEDHQRDLWIGTQSGLDILNKQTGEIRPGVFRQIGNTAVSCLLTTRKGEVWVGTDIGLFKDFGQKDTLIWYAGKQTGDVLPAVAIKSLLEDRNGDIWIGTWNFGLYRYSPDDHLFYRYPRMNDHNSAHIIFEDSRGQMWVGSWDEGLFCLKDPEDMDRVSWTNYKHVAGNAASLSDNIIYDITEDLHTNSLWIGTRSGLSVMSFDVPGSFINYKPFGSDYRIPSNEINSLMKDRQDNIWVGAIGGGVFLADTNRPKFRKYSFKPEEDELPTNGVVSMFVDQDDVWMGIGTYGIARYARETGKFSYYTRIPEFSDTGPVPTVYAIIRRKKTGDIWFGTYDGGIYVYRRGEPVKHYQGNNSDFIKYICVTALMEDRKGNCWVGTRLGLGVQLADEKGHLFRDMIIEGTNFEFCYVRDMIEDTNGKIWIATFNHGIICITGDPQHSETLSYKVYHPENKKLTSKSVNVLFEGSGGKIWAGTAGGGLFLYDPKSDRFDWKNRDYNLSSDVIGSIEEDEEGVLWMGTNNGLIRLGISEESKVTSRIYTSADGLQDNFFIARCSFNYKGELFFGGYKGYNSFFPASLSDTVCNTPFYITDIKIFNRSLSTYEAKLRSGISEKMPPYTQKIELPWKYNNFSFEFASLTYERPELNKYTYMLEGFDQDWQYANADRRFAYYNNLKSGTYTFLLRATNENGTWNNEIKKIVVVVLPPVWATWWAYTIYFLLLIAGVFVIYRTAQNRIVLKNQLRLKELEQSKIEEMNQAKLHFFTNITHELLTPLTIISAGVDELKIQSPGFRDLYGIMESNIQRLMRLLQQILEFRKAESGNLKLKVSKGDIAMAVKKGADNFLPVAKRKKLHFSVLCDPESLPGFFDQDKLDKILYNLLSNAAKYNTEGGFIQVTFSGKDASHVCLMVKDGGNGISKENMPHLFRRFYDGDYRKFHVTGTGIGLSLTKDLVELHKGSIIVESEEKKGSTFSVRLPIDRSFYTEDEVEQEIASPVMVSQARSYEGEQNAELPAMNSPANQYNLLLLEDDPELLQLMVRLLEREYHVFAGRNGKEGVEQIERENIDLIVSDVMMPEMDGYEFCRLVKNKLESSHIPVILLTAKNKEEDRAESYDAGADGYISKPFNLTVLHARIRNLLRHRERMANDFKNQLVFELKDMDYTSLDEEFMQRAIDSVNRHLDDPDFDQARFVGEMGTSKSTLYNKLKSLTGLNTSAFIRNVRLKAACRIMEEKGNIRVSELAFAVGFNDPKYFSSCFRREFHMLPSEYMDRFSIAKTVNTGITKSLQGS